MVLSRVPRISARQRRHGIPAACGGALYLGAVALGFGGLTGSASAQTTAIGDIVRSFCLTAFQSEMDQAGRQAPPGMADFACNCVANGIRNGSSLEAARSTCREATVRRYPI